jgi:hypothetical protein
VDADGVDYDDFNQQTHAASYSVPDCAGERGGKDGEAVILMHEFAYQ